MPLPQGGAPWPPESFKATLAEIDRSATWYSSDPAAMTLAGSTASFAESPDTSRRGFWSRRNRDSGARPRHVVHVPLAADVASTSAALLFGQPPSITHPDKKYQTLIDLLVDDGLPNTLLAAAESAAALGGVYLRASWDKDLVGHPFIIPIQHDAAVPTFRYGRLADVVFWTNYPGDSTGKTFRHFESHEMRSGTWWVQNALYEGDRDTVGYPVPLTTLDATARLEEEWDTGSPVLGVAYVPNALPNRRHRGSPLGRADISGSESLLDALDETWTSWMRDIRLGKGRIVVPETFLDDLGRGKGQQFDEDREVFVPVAVPANPVEGLSKIVNSQFLIRQEEHSATALALVERVVDHAGYSPQDFGLHIEGRAESGTALRIRRGRSLATVATKQRYWAPAIARVVAASAHLARTVFDTAIPADDLAVVEWQEEIDLPERATAVELLTRAAAISTPEKIRLVHPEWGEDEVAAEVQAILNESGMAAPDPMSPEFLP